MRLARKYSQPISEGTSSEAVDLFDYTSNIKDLTSNSMVKEDCDDLLDSIDKAVITGDKRKGIGDIDTEGLNGLSIFSPDFKEIFTSKESYDDLKFAQDTSWSETLLKLYENMEMEMKERVISFDVDLLSCRISDEDGDCLPDTMEYEFTIESSSNISQRCFLGINVYDLRGMYIDSTWTNLSLDPVSSSKIKITFYPEGEDADSGLFRIAAYLCLGDDFDPLSLQDYTRSGYRWLEVRN
jgi:hypothetical protein